MWRLIIQIISGVLGIWLAQKFVPGVESAGTIKTLFLAGAILGLANFFIKPILKIITLPIRIITLGLFGILINMFMVFLVEVLVPEFEVKGIIPLFWTSIIVWGLGFFLTKWLPEK